MYLYWCIIYIKNLQITLKIKVLVSSNKEKCQNLQKSLLGLGILDAIGELKDPITISEDGNFSAIFSYTRNF